MFKTLENVDSETVRKELGFSKLITTKDLAHALGISERTVAGWRHKGGGPRYTKAGRLCLYDLQDVREWLESRRRTSTSDDSVRQAAA